MKTCGEGTLIETLFQWDLLCPVASKSEFRVNVADECFGIFMPSLFSASEIYTCNRLYRSCIHDLVSAF
jgi:hypothetical protein